jgi:EmrB/QacA subfamily drug resistance transporter
MDDAPLARGPELTADDLAEEGVIGDIAAQGPARAPAHAAAAEPAEAELETEEEAKPFSSVVPAIIGTSMLMMTLNATVLSNALPTMAKAFHESPVNMNSAITTYMLASAVFLPVSGWAADKFGAKRIFMIAIVGTAICCCICGLTTSLMGLLIARLFQGAFGAMMGPVGRLVLLRSTPKHDLVRAMSVLTMPSMLGPVIGPPLGGFITTYGSWRWVFFFNVPIAILGLFLVWKYIKDIKEEGPAPLDWIGLVLTGVGMAGLVYGFQNVGRGHLSPSLIWGMMISGAVCLAIYTWHSGRTPHAILDLSLLKVKTFYASVVGGAFMRMGLGATPFLLAMLLQVGFGMTPFQAGMMTFASAAAALVMKTAAPPILARFGFRPVLSVNAVIVAITFMAYAWFTPTTPHWVLYAVLLCGGFFRSLQFTSLNGVAFADIERPQMSRATTMSTMGQQLSQSLGMAIAATLLNLSMAHAHTHHLTAAIIAPAFWVVGGVSLLSALFFFALPKDAGADLHGRPRPNRHLQRA